MKKIYISGMCLLITLKHTDFLNVINVGVVKDDNKVRTNGPAKIGRKGKIKRW